MTILVTGGAGYIGAHLVDGLLRAGQLVRVLDLEPVARRHGQQANCQSLQGSITDHRLVERAVKDVDVVVHLAWSFRTWRFYPESHPLEERREIEENLLGTINLLQAALAAGVRSFLFSGSAVVYGPTGPQRVTEDYPCHPERSSLGGQFYGITKWACEKLCLVYHQRGLPATVFRLHGVFGQDNLGQFQRMVQQAVAGEPVQAVRGAGGEYVHLDDVLRAFLLAMDHVAAQGEVFNLAGSHTYHEPELARYIIRTAASESQLEWVDDPLQGMISVSVEKIHGCLGYRPERGEFLTGLIRGALQGRA